MVTDRLCSDTGPSSCCRILSKEQSIGLKFIIFFSFCSLLAVLVTLAFYVDRVLTTFRHSSGWVFLKTDIDTYFLSLLFADMLVALGGILNLKWVNEGRTACGDFCSAQGGLEHVGTPAVALSTLAIALHTFFVIFFRWTPPRTRGFGLSVLTFIWTFLILLVLIPATRLSSGNSSPFYMPSPAWCYIGVTHIALRAGASYAFAWLAALISAIVYGLLFFRLRGALEERRDDGGLSGSGRFIAFVGTFRAWWFGDTELNGQGDGQLIEGRGRTLDGTADGDSEGRRSLEARKMLWYPLCYIIIILPLSVTRWMYFTEHNPHFPPEHAVPFRAMAAAASLFKLGGLIDVLLFASTRPNVLLVGAFRGNGGTESMGYRLFGRLRMVLDRVLKCLGRRVVRNSEVDEGGGEAEGEIEMTSVAAARGGLRVGKEIEGPGGGGSQVQLIPVRTRLDNHGASRPNELDIDLADELDYYPIPSSSTPSALSSSADTTASRTQSGRDSGVGNRSSLSPLRLNLPDARLSGLSKFRNSGSSSWIPMEREEHLAYLQASSSSGLGGPRTQGENPWSPTDITADRDDSRAVIFSEGEVSAQLPDESGVDSRERTAAFPDDGTIVHRTSLDKIPVTVTSERPTDKSLAEGDPFIMLSPPRLHDSVATTSRERRLRGPRPQPAPTSPDSYKVPGRQSRPTRPIIGIPASSIFAPLPASHSSTRSPHMRYPHSALPTIPEHHSLAYSTPSSARFSHSPTPTSPLSLRRKRPYTRRRSLSDGADLQARGRYAPYASDAENGVRTKYFSFIDMT